MEKIKKYRWIIAPTAATFISICIALVGCDRSGTTTQSVTAVPTEYKGNTPEIIITDDPAETVTDTCLAEDSIEDVAVEFRSLRTIKGHFEGATWNDDVDKWMGRKHLIMIQLGARLDTGEYSTAQVIQLLAPPDLIAREGDDFFDLISSLPEFERPAAGSYELLIYYWRGTHDILYFTSQGETIISSGWWYAGD